MTGLSKFIFVGRVAKITPLDRVTKVRAIANYARKGDDGDWQDDPHGITLAVFDGRRRRFCDTLLKVGDLIQAEDRTKDGSFERTRKRA